MRNNEEQRVSTLNGSGAVSKAEDEIAQVTYHLVLTDDISVVRTRGTVTEALVGSDITGTLVITAGRLSEGVLTLTLARQQRLKFLVTKLESNRSKYEIGGIGGIYPAE
jgi:hypothetical protein